MRYVKMILAVAFVFAVACSSYASTNIYNDSYTTEDSSGHWTFTSISTGKSLENVSVISNTPATLTSATSGRTYIVDGGTAGCTESTIVTITLPAADDTLTYKFVSGDGSGIVILTNPSSSDRLLYGSTEPDQVTTIRLTQKASGSTGATVTVHGNDDGYWYFSDINGTWAAE